jgi:hypothetical protein
MTLKIIDCTATPSSISVVFSDAVKGSDVHGKNDATNPANYTVQCPIGHSLGKAVPLPDNMAILYDDIRHTAVIPLKDAVPQGAWLSISVSGVTTISNVPFAAGTGDNTFATRVNGAGGIARDLQGRVGVARAAATGFNPVQDIDEAIQDAVSFPFLTEEVGYPPSPLSRSRGGSPGTPGASPLGQTASKAISDVLGWQVKDDPKAFVGALNASFALKTIEGRSEATWTPRTYAVQTDLSGGITGAQASVYTRAKDALDQSLPLLDGLYPLFKEAKDEDVVALRATVRSQFTDLVNELGLLGGPRISRVTQLFLLLLGQQLPTIPPTTTQPFALRNDPDEISGSLGNLRTEFGFSTSDDLINTVEDEQDVTNFRIVSDYVTSLAQSWLNNLKFFGLSTGPNTTTPFFGTQLVLLSRQLSVVAEAVNEVRFTLDSVFIGPAERQTLQIDFANAANPSMFLEDLFTWIDGFASDEGPRLIQDGGKFAVGESFVPISTRLQQLVDGLLIQGSQGQPQNASGLPKGYKTQRVQRSIEELAGQLKQLVNLAIPIKHVITPEPELSLALLSVNPTSDSRGHQPSLTIIGTGLSTSNPSSPTTVTFIGADGTTSAALLATSIQVLSENILFLKLGISQGAALGLYDIQVTQTVGSGLVQSQTAILGGAFTVTA